MKIMMKVLLNSFGVLLVLIGGVWFFQGIGVLPGSVMSGQAQWAVYGGLTAIGGVVLLVFSRRG